MSGRLTNQDHEIADLLLSHRGSSRTLRAAAYQPISTAPVDTR